MCTISRAGIEHRDSTRLHVLRGRWQIDALVMRPAQDVRPALHRMRLAASVVRLA